MKARDLRRGRGRWRFGYLTPAVRRKSRHIVRWTPMAIQSVSMTDRPTTTTPKSMIQPYMVMRPTRAVLVPVKYLTFSQHWLSWSLYSPCSNERWTEPQIDHHLSGSSLISDFSHTDHWGLEHCEQSLQVLTLGGLNMLGIQNSTPMNFDSNVFGR
jgi:hypothetical protein